MNTLLNNLLEEIFKEYRLDSLTAHEKRILIFNYLSKNLEYDEELLNQIKNSSAVRNPQREVLDVLEHKKGICNAIAQVYMLLLEKIGIRSVCVCCDDSTEIAHQLNIVKEENDYCFDDVTYAIFSEDKFSRFNYNIEKANSLGQGNRVIYDDNYWVMLPPSYVHAVIGEDSVEDLDENVKDFQAYIDSLNKRKQLM